MLHRWILAAAAAAVLVVCPTWAADENLQVEMLRELFRHPQPEWPPILQQNSGLLDQSFFDRVDKRIRWSAENNQVDDAVRFSMVADMACDAVGKMGGYRYALILLFQKAGNDEQARQLIENVLLTHPQFSEVRVLRAAYRRSDNDIPGAREDYDYLIGQNFQVSRCHYMKGIMCLTMAREDEARREFEAALAAEPGFELAKVELEKLKTVPSGQEMFEGVGLPPAVTGSFDPKQHANYFKMAEAEVKAGKLGAAEQHYKMAVAGDAKVGPYWINLGAIHYRLGNASLASSELHKGLEVSPKSIDGWRYLGCAYERMFDKDPSLAAALKNARLAFQKVLELQPGDPIASMALERLQGKKAKGS